MGQQEQKMDEVDDELYLYPGGEETLKIFPVEIWEVILEHVEDSKDLQNFCKAYPFWEEVLNRTKQAWLFDRVFLQVWPHLSKKEILGCRRVCRRWNASVDRFLENNEYHRPENATGNHLRRRPLIRGLRDIGLLYSPYSLMRMEKMCKKAQDHPRNPIIGRSLYIDWERIPSSYTPFLNNFGKHIWYLRVQCTQRDIRPIPFFLRIVQYLPHLPNLKKLELFLWEGQANAVGAYSSVTACDELDICLREHVRQHWHPHLETLELEFIGDFHGKVKDVLLTTFSQQIRRLSINSFSLSASFPKLTEVSITVDSNIHLECLLRLDSPITRLALSIVNHANYPLVFKAIQHFAPTVRALAVEFPTATSFSPVDWTQIKSPTLNLPCLKTLALKGCIPPSLNFITGLQSLQYIHVYDLRSSELVALLDNQTKLEEEIVQILKYLNQPSQSQKSGCMYQSNMWEVFPKLREFTFTNFTRRRPDVEQSFRRDHFDKIKQL